MIDREVYPMVLVVVAGFTELVVVITSIREEIDPLGSAIDVLVEMIVEVTSVDLRVLADCVIEIQTAGIVRHDPVLTSTEVHLHTVGVAAVGRDLHGATATHEG